jgi:hypothetical protein
LRSSASALLLAAALAGCAGGARPGETPPAEGRALAFLAAEVPSWHAEKGCYSCHHNGDAARALFTARRLRREVPAESLADTLEWLSSPDRWDRQKDSPAFNDQALARLQFAASLAAAVEAGLIRNRSATAAAAGSVAALQAKDGAWPVEPREELGSPATWGTYLATAMACRTLEALDRHRFQEALDRGRSWLRAAPVRNVLEAAAVLLGLGPGDPEGVGSRTAECLSLIDRGRAPRGGWGPYLNSPPEPFDTAVVLLALEGLDPSSRVRDWIREGRAFLLTSQRDDGSWPATTRPRGGESRAQATSTAGWAALALLRTGGSW